MVAFQVCFLSEYLLFFSRLLNPRRGTPFYIATELVEEGRATTASDL